MRSTLHRPFAVLALLTLALTGVRLAGELALGPEILFGRSAGGGGALLGIGWLIPVAGFVFGRRLAASEPPPDGKARALRRVGLGLLGTVLVMVTARTVLPVTVVTFTVVAVALPVFTVFAWRAWPALAGVLLLYAVAARVPILVITAFAVAGNWGTHYEQLAPGAPEMSGVARTVVLCLAQACLWLPMTVQFGCLVGLLAARGRRQR